MGKRSSSPPPAPDPAQTIAAQSAANKDAVRETALVNQINQRTPFGSLNFTGEIGSPDRTVTQSLTPEGQSQLDQRNRLAAVLGGLAEGRAGQITTDPFSLAGLPGAPVADDATRQRVEQASFQRARGLLDPVFGQQRDQLTSTLEARGIPVGSELFNTQFGNLDRSQNQAFENAANTAVLTGGQEQSRLFGLEGAQRDRGISERLTERNQPFNELAAFLQGSPALQGPQFQNTNTSPVLPVDTLGAQSLSLAQQNQAFQASQQRNQGLLGGLFGLGSAAITGNPFNIFGGQ